MRQHRTRPTGVIATFVATFIAAGFMLGSAALAQRQFLSIGGGSTGGTFNTFSSGIADFLSQNLDGLNMTVEGSAGSAENIRRIQGGDLEMGIAFAGDAYLSYNGLACAASRPRPSTPAARTTGPRPASISSTIGSTSKRGVGCTARCWRCGATRVSSGIATTCSPAGVSAPTTCAASGCRAGTTLPEEAPEATVEALLGFLQT